jgi:MFS transporter, AAHS family, 3-hydroxyphenylpropionic acid transporter
MEFQPTTKELNTYRVLILCATVILLEGFDIQAAGVSATELALAFNLAPFGKGMFLGASAVGIFIASVLGGFLADKYGCKPIVVSSVIIFGIFSLSTLLAKGLGTMIAARFMIGLGLAYAMPAVIAYASRPGVRSPTGRGDGRALAAMPHLVWHGIPGEILVALSPIQTPFLQMQVAEPSYPRPLHPSKLREQ